MAKEPEQHAHPVEGPAPAEPSDDLVTTTHTLTVDVRELAYTATTGRVVLREEVVDDGAAKGHEPKAEVFLTSYVLGAADLSTTDARPADVGTRPVVFAFNGGPGSASVWLHLGLLPAGGAHPPPRGPTPRHQLTRPPRHRQKHRSTCTGRLGGHRSDRLPLQPNL